MNDEGFLRILAGDDLHRPLIGADRDNLLGDEPLRRVLADAGLARVEGGVLGGELIEEVAPASVDDDDVALAQRHVVHLEPCLDVGGRDHGPLVQARLAAGRVALELPRRLEDSNGVDEDAAGGEGLEMLEAELRDVVLVDVLAHRDLVEVTILAPDVPHSVEVRADVALAEPRVLHIRQLVLAESTSGRERRRGQDRLRETGPEQRDSILQNPRHRDDLALLDLGRGRLRDRGGDAIGRAGLIIGSPGRRRDDLGAIALGKRDGR